jgi:hypothetical protein
MTDFQIQIGLVAAKRSPPMAESFRETLNERESSKNASAVMQQC